MKFSQKQSFALAVALGSFALIGGTGLTVSSAWLITMASQHPPVLVLSVAIVMVRFFGIFRSLARYGERVISHEAIFRKLTGVRENLFTAISLKLRGPSHVFAAESKAIIDDVERAQEFHLRVTLPGISALIAGLTTVALALWIQPLMVPWFLVTTLLFSIVIPFSVKRFLDPLAARIEECENDLAIEISEASHALVEAEVFGYADQYRARLAQYTSKLSNLESKNFRRTSFLQLLAISGVGITLIAISSSFQTDGSALPIHISMAIFLALVGFEGYSTWFPNLFPSGKNRQAALSVSAVAVRESEKSLTFSTPVNHLLVASDVVPFWEKKFLAPINFSLARGESLVITGASGAGKSTLAASLLGFAPYIGSLTIGGAEVSNIENLSEYITGTLQHGYIFNTTVRENLKVADSNASDKGLREILNSVELAELSLDEVLGEFGRNLSGGEAKRLSLARALLSPAPIVILDEPLEHLDYQRSLRLQESIAKLTAQKSLIVITHTPWLQYSRKLLLTRE